MIKGLFITNFNASAYPIIPLLAIVALMSGCEDGTPATSIDEEELKEKSDDTARIIENVQEAKSAMLERIDLSNSSIAMDNFDPTGEIVLEQIDLASFLKEIDFVVAAFPDIDFSRASARNFSVGLGNEEGRPSIRILNDKETFLIDAGRMPAPSAYDTNKSTSIREAEDQRLQKKVEAYLSTMGLRDKSQYELDFGSMVLTEVKAESPEVERKWDYGRIVRVYRKLNGVPILSNKIVFNFDVEGSLWRIGGKWNQISLERSSIAKGITAGEIVDIAVEGLVKKGINGRGKRNIKLSLAYRVQKEHDSKSVIKLNVMAKTPIDNGQGGYTGEIHAFEL